MNLNVLDSLRLDLVVGIELRPYTQIGYEFVNLYFASGRIVTVRSTELDNVPFDAYSIEIEESHRASSTSDSSDRKIIPKSFMIEHLELFHRDEWEDIEPVQHMTVGQNPVAIAAGPVGSAPTGVVAITVLSGLVLRPKADSDSSINIFLNDFPGLLIFSEGNEEMDLRRSEASSELLW